LTKLPVLQPNETFLFSYLLSKTEGKNYVIEELKKLPDDSPVFLAILYLLVPGKLVKLRRYLPWLITLVSIVLNLYLAIIS
jgi:hypothetical protein